MRQKWSQKFDKCQKCGTTENKHYSNGLCRSCYNKEYSKEYIKRPEYKDKCKIRRQTPGYKKQHKKYMEKFLLEHKEYKKSYDLKRNYGISLEQRDLIIEQQEGLCIICNRRLDMGKYTHVDHDHNTGKVRGILCHNCNAALGMFNESIPTLKNAINYLETQISDCDKVDNN